LRAPAFARAAEAPREALELRALPPPRREERREVPSPRWRVSAVSRATSLLKFDRSPPEVCSWYTSARFDSSNLRNQSSHEIGRSLPSPLNPGKSIRMIPVSPSPVPITSEGVPPRSSAHRLICS
jgi:hypothetical protein